MNTMDTKYKKMMKTGISRQNIVTLLREIFPNDCVPTDTKIELMGGMTNQNFKIEVNGKKYVMRIPGIGTEGMIERNNEEVNSYRACDIGISPPIQYYDINNAIKLTEYIDGAETLKPSTIQNFDNLNLVIDILKRLHNSDIRMNNEFNVFKEIVKYESLMNSYNAEMYDGWPQVRRLVFSLETRLNQLGVELRPCHNDLVPENFIKDRKGKIYLIDWEYSGINDPLSDLASLFIESEFSEESELHALNRYFDGDIPESAKEKITIYQILLDYLWSIWSVIKKSQGDNFGSYGQDRFNRAKLGLKKLLH